jgi:hypothetical protein
MNPFDNEDAEQEIAIWQPLTLVLATVLILCAFVWYFPSLAFVVLLAVLAYAAYRSSPVWMPYLRNMSASAPLNRLTTQRTESQRATPHTAAVSVAASASSSQVPGQSDKAAKGATLMSVLTWKMLADQISQLSSTQQQSPAYGVQWQFKMAFRLQLVTLPYRRFDFVNRSGWCEHTWHDIGTTIRAMSANEQDTQVMAWGCPRGLRIDPGADNTPYLDLSDRFYERTCDPFKNLAAEAQIPVTPVRNVTAQAQPAVKPPSQEPNMNKPDTETQSPKTRKQLCVHHKNQELNVTTAGLALFTITTSGASLAAAPFVRFWQHKRIHVVSESECEYCRKEREEAHKKQEALIKVSETQLMATPDIAKISPTSWNEVTETGKGPSPPTLAEGATIMNEPEDDDEDDDEDEGLLWEDLNLSDSDFNTAWCIAWRPNPLRLERYELGLHASQPSESMSVVVEPEGSGRGNTWAEIVRSIKERHCEQERVIIRNIEDADPMVITLNNVWCLDVTSLRVKVAVTETHPDADLDADFSLLELYKAVTEPEQLKLMIPHAKPGLFSKILQGVGLTQRFRCTHCGSDRDTVSLSASVTDRHQEWRNNVSGTYGLGGNNWPPRQSVVNVETYTYQCFCHDCKQYFLSLETMDSPASFGPL